MVHDSTTKCILNMQKYLHRINDVITKSKLIHNRIPRFLLFHVTSQQNQNGDDSLLRIGSLGGDCVLSEITTIRQCDVVTVATLPHAALVFHIPI